jgi:uncharacterized RDD family membrane protein YckC
MYCSQCGAKSADGAKFCVDCGNALALTHQATVAAQDAYPLSPKWAGFWLRTLAAIIDALLCQILAVVLVVPLGFALGASMAGESSSSDIEAAAQAMGFVVGFLIQWLWFTLAESSHWQASIGKKLLGLKVTDANGERISFGKANARYWSKILSTLLFCVGFLMVAFTAKKQGLHDKIAKTLVVKSRTAS